MQKRRDRIVARLFSDVFASYLANFPESPARPNQESLLDVMDFAYDFWGRVVCGRIMITRLVENIVQLFGRLESPFAFWKIEVRV